MLGPRPSLGRRRRVWPWTRRWAWWCGTTGSRRSRARWAVIGGECRYSPLIGWARTTPTWTTSTPPSWGTARATWWAGMVVFTMFEKGTSKLHNKYSVNLFSRTAKSQKRMAQATEKSILSSALMCPTQPGLIVWTLRTASDLKTVFGQFLISLNSVFCSRFLCRSQKNIFRCEASLLVGVSYVYVRPEQF